MERKPEFSKRETLKGLQRFLYTGAFWGAYGQIAVVTAPIFTGFALWLGLTEAHIATLASISALGGLIQPFSLLLTNRIQDKKRFIVGMGFLEIGLVMSVATIPLFVPPGARIPVLMAMVLLGTTMGHIVSPTFSGWFATMIPEDIRARYLSRRMTVVYIVSIGVGYGAGRLLDLVPGYRGFSILFLFGFLTGVAGYLTITGIAFPKQMEKQQVLSVLQIVRTPLRNGSFAWFMLFYALWSFSAAVAQPFYSVFMLKTLSIQYSTVAIFNMLSMMMQILGYRFWGRIVDRYGGKPVLQVLMVPRIILPALWIFSTPGNYMFVLPAVMIVSGLIFSGLTVAVSPLLYSLLPEEDEKTAYFASWSFSNSIVAAIGPAVGGLLVSRLRSVHLGIGASWEIGHLQMMFLISAALMIVPALLLKRVIEIKASTPGYLLGQLRRGNPFAFAYNFYLFSRTAEESKRAQAARAMGRSRSPMAIEQLVVALDDLSPEVRSQAAKGLGETRNPDAVAPLIEKLHDEESDIRSEAAEALGKLRHHRGIDPLFAALNDADRRVRISAIRALAIIGGQEVRKRLFLAFCGPFDRVTFPALVDALSRMGDLRIVRPTIERLRAYRSPVIRLQLLNALCRTLGAKDRFYKLLSYDELGRTQQIHHLLQQSRKRLSSIGLLDADRKAEVLRLMDQALEHFDLEQGTKMTDCLAEIAKRVEQAQVEPNFDPRIPWDQTPSARIGAGLQAIGAFVRLGQTEEIVQEREIFLTVCLAQVVELMEKHENEQHPERSRKIRTEGSRPSPHPRAPL